MTHNIALIVAAGRGHRFGGALPKQYRCLLNNPIIGHSIKAFSQIPLISAIRVVIAKNDTELYLSSITNLDNISTEKLLPHVNGGGSRQESVRLGLESLHKEKPNIVLIHDAARPLVNYQTISNIINSLQENEGAIAALPLHDSLKYSGSNEELHIKHSISRAHLWRAQTPQGFHFSKILKAHKGAKEDTATDDASIAESCGISVALVLGTEDNIKITTEADMKFAEEILKGRQHTRETNSNWRVKVGFGYDVHRVQNSGSFLTLCGVRIPFEGSILSHSDGDIILHSLTDAIYGVLGENDIGFHFPPSNEKWRNCSSTTFVKHALKLLSDKDGILDHVDLTLICEKPKLSNYRKEMKESLRKIVNLDLDAISIKATTTEKLGFTGREEGIAAHATVTVRLPVGEHSQSNNE